MSGKRSQARSLALQALYQWQMSGQDLAGIEGQFLEEHDPGSFDLGLFRDLLHGVPGDLGALDGALVPLLDRAVARVDPVERAVLRIGTYELMHHPDIPFQVVIDEAVELAKVFGAEQGHRYVNGVLDRLAQRLRPHESGPRKGRKQRSG